MLSHQLFRCEKSSALFCLNVCLMLESSVTTSIAATFAQVAKNVFMPNGTRTPYRIISGRPPSPAHTSDSEDTANEKYEYQARSMRALPSLLRHYQIGSIIFSFLTTETRRNWDHLNSPWHMRTTVAVRHRPKQWNIQLKRNHFISPWHMNISISWISNAVRTCTLLFDTVLTNKSLCLYIDNYSKWSFESRQLCILISH